MTAETGSGGEKVEPTSGGEVKMGLKETVAGLKRVYPGRETAIEAMSWVVGLFVDMSRKEDWGKNLDPILIENFEIVEAKWRDRLTAVWIEVINQESDWIANYGENNPTIPAGPIGGDEISLGSTAQEWIEALTQPEGLTRRLIEETNDNLRPLMKEIGISEADWSSLEIAWKGGLEKS